MPIINSKVSKIYRDDLDYIRIYTQIIQLRFGKQIGSVKFKFVLAKYRLEKYETKILVISLTLTHPLMSQINPVWPTFFCTNYINKLKNGL